MVDASTPDAMCKPGLCPQPPDFRLEIWDLKLGIARFPWCGICVVAHCVTQDLIRVDSFVLFGVEDSRMIRAVFVYLVLGDIRQPVIIPSLLDFYWPLCLIVLSFLGICPLHTLTCLIQATCFHISSLLGTSVDPLGLVGQHCVALRSSARGIRVGICRSAFWLHCYFSIVDESPDSL